MINNLLNKKNINKKFIIDTTLLQKGDIIFSTTHQLASKTIRIVTKSNYSHVMLYVDRLSIIHADGKGVHADNPQRMLFDNINHCEVYRLPQMNEEQLNIAINYLRTLIGRPYSTVEAILSPYYKGRYKSKKLFCSRLIANAFNKANIELVNNPDYCTPEDIKNSCFLTRIVSPLRELNEIDKDIIFHTVDKIEIQKSTTNKLFQDIRKYTSNKEIIDETSLIEFLKKNKSMDKSITEILRKSGYLTLWVKELQTNVPLYDSRLYSFAINLEQKLQYQMTTRDFYVRYKNQQSFYYNLSKEIPLQFFKDYSNLYNILVNQASTMLRVVKNDETGESFKDFSIFFKTLINLFYIRLSLLYIQKDNTFNFEDFNFALQTIFIVNENSNQILPQINKFQLEKSFSVINDILGKVSSILNNIIYTEMRQHHNPNKLYTQLSDATDELVKAIDQIEYVNIVIYF